MIAPVSSNVPTIINQATKIEALATANPNGYQQDKQYLEAKAKLVSLLQADQTWERNEVDALKSAMRKDPTMLYGELKEKLDSEHRMDQHGDLKNTLDAVKASPPSGRYAANALATNVNNAKREFEEYVTSLKGDPDAARKVTSVLAEVEAAGIKRNTLSQGLQDQIAAIEEADKIAKKNAGEKGGAITGLATAATATAASFVKKDEKSNQILQLKEGQLIQFGDEDPQGQKGKVALLQEKMAQLGLYKGEIDGKFGEGTRGSLEAFQKSQKIAVDGIVGKETSDALDKAVSGQVIGSVVQATAKVKDDTVALASKVGEQTKDIASNAFGGLNKTLAGLGFGDKSKTQIALANDVPINGLFGGIPSQDTPPQRANNTGEVKVPTRSS